MVDDFCDQYSFNSHFGLLLCVNEQIMGKLKDNCLGSSNIVLGDTGHPIIKAERKVFFLHLCLSLTGCGNAVSWLAGAIFTRVDRDRAVFTHFYCR